MLRFIGLLLLLLGSVWLGLKVVDDPGFALFSYRNWTMEMPLWVALLGFVVLIFLLFFFMRLFDNIDVSLYRLKNWLHWRRKYKAYSKTHHGILDLIEGDWRSAERFLLEGIAQSDAPLINYLAAARAAQQQGNYEKRDEYLRDAHRVAPSAEVTIGLVQAQSQMEQGRLEQALATLKHLRTIAPKHKQVLRQLQKLYVQLPDWNELSKLLPILRKTKALNESQLAALEKNVYQQSLQTTAKSSDLAALQQVWKTIPRAWQKDPAIIYCYTKQLSVHTTAMAEAEELINKAVKKAWDSDLVKLYGSLKLPNPKKQLAHAESWHAQYGDQAVLLLTLGRLCARCQLWGKARGYFEDSLKLHADPETYTEYGKLLEQLGETEEAVQHYREGLLMVSTRM